MNWILFGACIAACLLGIRLFRLKRQLHHVTTQLNEHLSEETEKIVTVALMDDDLSKLASAINHNLELQKKLRINVRRNDLQLKASIANLSHDLRTPLTSILGYLQLSRDAGCSDEKREEYLKTADEKAHVLKSMLNSLYELSMLDVRETPLKTEKLDLNLLLGDVLAGQYEFFQKLGITLDVHLLNHPAWIMGDSVACARIVQNLLNNALQYAKGFVRINLIESESCVFLSLCNPAPNLKMEDINHLFERFYTADKSRNSGGSGLGLYIVKALLEKMNGKVTDISLSGQTLRIEVGFHLSK